MDDTGASQSVLLLALNAIGMENARSKIVRSGRAGKKLYVNLTGSDEVGVIDLKNRQIIATWPLPDAHVAHAIALDESNHRLFTATRKPAQFIVYNTFSRA